MAKISAIHIPAELRNHAINGALDFWQEKVGTTTTVNTATSTNTRFADMFAANSQGATTKNYSIVRSVDVPTIAQSGFQSTYSSLFTMVTGITSPAANDLTQPFFYAMEGYDYQKLHTKVVTFGFWVKASVPGTYSCALANSANTRCYVTTFTVNGAATWEFKTITVPLDNTGTWLFDTGVGIYASIGAIAGANFTTSTLNQWQTATVFCASTATNWQATAGATFQVAQFSIVEGSLGLGATGFARKGDSIQEELVMCQRYYEKTYELETTPGTATTNGSLQKQQFNNAAFGTSHYWNVRKRSRGYTTTFFNPATGSSTTVQNTTAGGLTYSLQGGEPAGVAWSVTQAPGIANTSIVYHVVGDARL